jgi:hypothetical protein
LWDTFLNLECHSFRLNPFGPRLTVPYLLTMSQLAIMRECIGASTCADCSGSRNPSRMKLHSCRCGNPLFPGREGHTITIILTFYIQHHSTTMLTSTNQYKAYATFLQIITYAFILVHLSPRRNALITITSLPPPPPPPPPSTAGAQPSLLSTQQQNAQLTRHHRRSRRGTRWQTQPLLAHHHCKHPYHIQKHSPTTEFDRYSIGWPRAEDEIIAPHSSQICRAMRSDQVRQSPPPSYTSLPKCSLCPCRNACWLRQHNQSAHPIKKKSATIDSDKPQKYDKSPKPLTSFVTLNNDRLLSKQIDHKSRTNMNSNTNKSVAPKGSYTPNFVPHLESGKKQAPFKMGPKSSNRVQQTLSFASAVKKTHAAAVSADRSHLQQKIAAAKAAHDAKEMKKTKLGSNLSKKGDSKEVLPPSPVKKTVMNPGTNSSPKKRVQMASPARETAATVSQPDSSITSSPAQPTKLKYSYSIAVQNSPKSSPTFTEASDDTMDLIISGDLPLDHKIKRSEVNNESDDSSEDSPVLPVNPKKVTPKPTPINLFNESSDDSISSKSSNDSSATANSTKPTASKHGADLKSRKPANHPEWEEASSGSDKPRQPPRKQNNNKPPVRVNLQPRSHTSEATSTIPMHRPRTTPPISHQYMTR